MVMRCLACSDHWRHDAGFMMHNHFPGTPPSPPPRILYHGQHLQLAIAGTWEFVQRIGARNAVGIVALTPQNNLLLISQFRIPLQKTVIEIPAGLIGDHTPGPGDPTETWQTAAARELREETGWTAADFQRLTEGPTSSGLTCERVILVRALRLTKAGPPQPDGDEHIILHEVPLPNVESFLRDRERHGDLVDPKVWAALYFLGTPR